MVSIGFTCTVHGQKWEGGDWTVTDGVRSSGPSVATCRGGGTHTNSGALDRSDLGGQMHGSVRKTPDVSDRSMDIGFRDPVVPDLRFGDVFDTLM